jgi:hypothetical protein
MLILRNRLGLQVFSIIIILSIFISGCVSLPDPEVSQDSHSEIIAVVNSSRTLSQTFEIRRDGFNSITIWVGSEREGSETTAQGEKHLKINLYSLSEPYNLIHHTTINLSDSIENQSFTVSFPPQADSSGMQYSLELSVDTGTVKVYGRNENSYPYGQSFVNMQPLEADIAFSTTYDYDTTAFRNDVEIWINNINLIPSFIIVLFLPGWLLLKFCCHQHSFDFGQRIGISVGISLATIPVVLLWTSTIGVPWTKTVVMFFSGLLVAVWLIVVIRDQFFRRTLSGLKNLAIKINDSGSNVLTYAFRKSASGLYIPTLLIIIFIISLAVRLIMVRDLVTPAWVDSVHHALITRIISETGTLPETYLPYLDLSATDYHPGFHSQLATFLLLSNLDIPSAMLLFGQVINAMMVISVYTFTKGLTNSEVTGIFAGLITGLFTPMPAYYTSWGRYTQLSGLLILPTAYILFTIAINYKNKIRWINFPLLIAALTISGLFLTHYRVTAFFILLIIAEFIINRFCTGPDDILTKWKVNRFIIYSGLGAIMLLPWLIQSIPDTFLPSLLRPLPEETKWFSDFSWRFLSTALGKQALAISGLGLIWGLIQKKRFVYLLLLWIVLLSILANIKVLGLPGGGLMNTTSVEISLFIPISVFGGYFINEILHFWKSISPRKIRSLLYIVSSFLMVYIVIIAAKNITSILNPITILSRKADISAIMWIKENIRTDKLILINPFPWGYGIFAGNDGGYWITPLTGIKTIPPPVLYGFTPNDDRKFINQISQFVIDNGSSAAELHDYLKSNDINYVYIGARGGPISPMALLNHAGFKSIYENQGVWIFELSP